MDINTSFQTSIDNLNNRIDTLENSQITQSALEASITKLQADTTNSLNQLSVDINTSFQTSIDNLNNRIDTLENSQITQSALSFYN